MKKAVGIFVAAACLILSLFYFLTLRPEVSSDSSNPSSSQNLTKSTVDQTSENNSTGAKRWTRAAKGDAAPVAMGTRIVSHKPADFENGSPENAIVTDGLQMGNNPAFVSRVLPYKTFGLYISPEESYAELFDVIVPKVEATSPEGSDLTFEFRTRPPGRDWTVWEEVTDDRLNQPFHLDAPAAAWQYRITFYANDSASSPKVLGVKMETQAAKNLAATENQNDLPVSTQ